MNDEKREFRSEVDGEIAQAEGGIGSGSSGGEEVQAESWDVGEGFPGVAPLLARVLERERRRHCCFYFGGSSNLSVAGKRWAFS